jgi:glutathione reductase (NADPH)
MIQCDLIVIGAGSGGLALARRAATLYHQKVVLVERNVIGGTCVNVGCVPKKIMFNAATIADYHIMAPCYGFDKIHEFHLKWNDLKCRRDAYIEQLHHIYHQNIDKAHINYVHGCAKMVDAHTVDVNGQHYKADHVVIATGSRPIIPEDHQVPGAAKYGMTSDGFFDLLHQPQHVAIIGAGYVATELAGIFRALGSHVDMFIRDKYLLRRFDRMLQTMVTDYCEASGVRIHRYCDIVKVEKDARSIEPSSILTLHVAKKKSTLADGHEIHTGYDCLIWAIGRQGCVDGLNLEVLNVNLDAMNHIVVDDYQNSSVKGIYALGDVCGKFLLTPVAIAAGRALADRLFGGNPSARLDYRDIPTVVFAHPLPLGTVGLTEDEALEKFGTDSVRVYLNEYRNLFYALGHPNSPRSAVKLICVKNHGESSEKVVGIHTIGYGSDEMLQGFAVALKMGATKSDFDRTVAIHPTAAEEFVTFPSSNS